MAERSENTGERLVRVETEIKNLREITISIDASLKQTTLEFRQAFDRHRDNHKDEARISTDLRWKFITIIVTILTFLVSFLFSDRLSAFKQFLVSLMSVQQPNP